MVQETRKNLLVFGYGLGLIAAVFGVGGLIKHGPGWAPLTLLTCALVFVTVTAFNWEALKPGYRGWMKVAHLIGAVVTTVLLGAVFFLVFTPVALLLRLLGKDHLERRLDAAAATYWHERPHAAFDKQRYTQQF